MWSKLAPPSDSGRAMPVRPSSAAFLKVAWGKWPVSSSSLASGRTSDSANSRTVFWRRDCSSVRSRFMGGSSLAQKMEKDLHRGHRERRGRREEKTHPQKTRVGHRRFAWNDKVVLRLGGEGFVEPLIRNAELLGVDTGFSDHGHEIGIAEPAWESMKMEVAGDA